jgi:hypothetical protein
MSTAASADPVVVSAARWFWWIAGLSLVNTVLFFSGSTVNFVIGLGLTTLTNVYFGSVLPMAIAAAGVILGFYVFIGLKAQQGSLWAFYVGAFIYALDALIFVPLQDWFPVAFHAFALYCIYRGIARLRELRSAPAPAAPGAAEPSDVRESN